VNELKTSRRREAEVSALLKGSRAIIENRTFEEAARAIFDTCKELISATSGYVALLTDEGDENEVLFLDAGGLPCTVDPSLPMPIRGLRGEAYRTGRTVYDNGFEESEWMAFMPEGHVRLENVLFTPLMIESKAVGLLGIANKSGGFDDNDARLATAFGELAAVSLFKSRSQQSRGESEERFRELAQLLPQTVFEMDLQGRLSFVNQVAFDLFGYTREDFEKGLSCLQMVAHEDRRRAQENIGRIVKGEKLRGLEYAALRKDGSTFPVIIHSNVVMRDGRPVGLRGIIIDISERKKAAAEIEEWKDRYEAAVMASGHVLYDWDPVSNDVTYGGGVEEILGYTMEEMEGGLSRWTELIHPEDMEHFNKVIEHLIATKEKAHLEYRVRRKDGGYIFVEDSGNFIMDHEGNPTRMIGFVKDVTERKRAEEERSRILELTQDLICVAGADGYFKYLNPAWENTLGYSQEELLSRPFLDFIHPEDHGRNDEEVASLLTGKKTVDFENRYLHKDGSVVTLSWTATPFMEEGVFYCIGRNITARKRADEELMKANEMARTAEMAAHAGSWSWDMRTNEVMWSENLCQLHGIEPGDFGGTFEAAVKFIHPDDLEHISKLSQEMLAEKASKLFEYRILTADGVEKFVQGTNQVILDDNGEISRVVGMVQDVTKRRKMEEALKNRTHDLGERIKELNGLYEISRLMAEPGRSLESFFREMIRLIPLAWQYPDITCARIRVGDLEFTTDTFSEAIWKQSADILVHGKKVGSLDVYYTEERQAEYEGPFLREERDLLDTFVREIGKHIERKKAEEALEERTNFLDRIIESSALSTWISDEEGTAIRANPACLEFFGATEEEVIGKYNLFQDVVIEQKGFMPDIKRVFEEGEVANIVIDYDFGAVDHVDVKDATHKIINSIFTPVLDSDGKVSNVIVQSIDLTDMKKAEEALRETQEKLETVIDHSDEVFYIHDTNHQLTYVSPQCEAVFGYTPEEMMVKWTTRITDNPINQEGFELTERAINTGERQRPYLLEIRRKDGEPILVEIEESPVKDEGGKVVAMSGALRDVTERRKAEEALLAQKEFTDRLIDSLSDTFYLFDPETGEGLRWNRALEDISGYDYEEMRHYPPTHFYPKEEHHRIEEVIGSLQETGHATVELSYITKNGSRIPFEYSTVFIKDPEGKTLACAIGRNLTERRKAQEEVERLAKFPSENPNPVLRISKDGVVLYGNQSSAPLLELWECQTGERLSPEWQKFALDALEAKALQWTEATCGGRTFSLTYAPVPTSNYVNVYGLDITGRKKAEARLQNLMDNLPGMAYRCPIKEGWPLSFISDGCLAITGYSPEELCHPDRPLYGDLIHPDDREMVWQVIQEAISRDSIFAIEYRITDKSGNEHWLYEKGRAVDVIDGTTFLEGFVSDITELKKVERERTLLNIQLASKNKELEQIIYVTSHDLRSPLVNVQGFSKELEHAARDITTILQDEDVPARVREKLAPVLEEDIPVSVGFILTSITKMDGLLAGLLRLSRLGRVFLSMEELNMNELIEDVAQSQEFLVKEREVRLDIGELPSCPGDRGLMNQVFSNLLDNAIKYLDPSRPGEIRISGRREGEMVKYCVEDNGIGIDPAHQDKIFQIFHRLDPEATTGEGLGLNIVLRILDRHRGGIEVESEPGKGTRFCITLPASQ